MRTPNPMRRARLARGAALWFCCMALAGVGAQSSAPQIERAYRENNLGVAWMEQFSFDKAAAHFQSALRLHPSLGMARFNLALAHYYAGKLEAARQDARAAAQLLPTAPQPAYLEGLIAHTENRPADAAAAFLHALRLVPTDVGANIGLGQVRLQTRDPAAAVAPFRAALAAEPYNATAAYGLATALSRAGQAEEGRKALARFQALRQSGTATSYGNSYLEQGRLAEAMLSTGIEPELVRAAMPTVRFTAVGVRAGARRDASLVGGINVADVDGDADIDVLEAAADGLRLWRNDGRGNLREDASAFARASATGAVAGDLTGDGTPEVLVLTPSGVRLQRNDGRGNFTDATQAAGLAKVTAAALATALVDVDHDGDLDIVVPPGESASRSAARVLRNDGSAVFTDVGRASGIAGAGVIAIVPTDYDERRDVDLLLVGSGTLALFRNRRDGTFEDAAASAQLPPGTNWSAVAAGDINKDGRTDLFLGRPAAPGLFVLSSGRERFRVRQAPASTAGALASLLFDYDNDGLLDLVTLGATAAHLFRNIGAGWADATVALPPYAGALNDPQSTRRGLVAADVDGDGDTDLVLRTAEGLRVWRNDGGQRLASLAVRLTGRVSNRSAVGAKVELRAGSLRDRRELTATTPAVTPADVVFGLGAGRQADAVRILWPSGILQAELPESPTPALAITEVDRKPSSCPFLFTWNGERFEFVTDFLGGGEMGYWQAPGVRNTPDPDEYVRIPGSALRARDGRFELRITNELEEAVFLDAARLHVVDHAAGTEVYPVEGLHATPRRGLRLVAVADTTAPLEAVDDRGRDQLAEVIRQDFRAPEFELAPFRGYAPLHALEIVAPDRDGLDVLLLSGWTDYAFSSDNVAASQARLVLAPPRLEVQDLHGAWRDAGVEVGVPGGRPQTLVVDLSRQPRVAGQRFRIITSMRIYWDHVRFARRVEGGVTTTALPASARADLRRRGFSRPLPSGPGGLLRYDYDRVSTVSPWKQLVGRYTAEGDVAAQLVRSDGAFVVAAPGDQVAVAFDARDPDEPGAGRIRTYLLEAVGYSKEMDLHSASPDEVGPLPHHVKSAIAPPHRQPREGPGWRTLTRSIPLIESLLVDRVHEP